jgi:ClpP class serine protease
MIRSDLTYALAAGKPLLIDPIKANAFLAHANLILSNPDLAYMLSQFTAADGYQNKLAKVGPLHADGESGEPDTMAAELSVAKNCNPYVVDGVGIIPVRGVIGKGLTRLEAMLGCADVDVISQTLDAWDERDDIFEVLFQIDSGGGSTTGLEELAKKIRNYPKPTVGFSDSDCGSAAFWIGSQCKRLVVTPSSSIGACGVYITLTDESEKYAKEGKEVIVLKSGEHKAAGVEGTKLSKVQKEALQGEVDELHRRFIRDVQTVRSFAKVEDLQGQSFYGDVAASRGLATGVVDSLDDLIESMKDTRRIAARTTLPSLYNPNAYGSQPYVG